MAESSAQQFDSWFPDYPIRPVGIATSHDVALKKMAAHLMMCLLHTPIDLKSYIAKFKALSKTYIIHAGSAGYSHERVEGYDPKGVLTDFLDRFDLFEVGDLLIANTVSIVSHWAAEGKIPTNRYAILYPTSFQRDLDDDADLVDAFYQLFESEDLTDDDRKKGIKSVESMFSDIVKEETFLAGRGRDSWDSTSIRGVKEWLAHTEYERDTFQVFALPLEIEIVDPNFSLASLGRVARRAFNFVDVAKDVAICAFQTFMGKPKLIDGDTLSALDKLTGKITSRGVREGFLDNIRNADFKRAINSLRGSEIMAPINNLMTLLAFYVGKKGDSSFDPRIGAPFEGDVEFKENERAMLDNNAMSLATLAANLFGSNLRDYDLPDTLWSVLKVHFREVMRSPSAGQMRNPPASFANQETYGTLSEFFTAYRSALTNAFNKGDDGTFLKLLALVLTDPEMFAAIDASRDILDQADVQGLVTQIGNLEASIARKEEQIRELQHQYTMAAAGTPTVTQPPQEERRPVAIAQSQYTNWSLSTQLVAHAQGTWADLHDALDTVARINSYGFKYDSQRDSCRATLLGMFKINLNINQYRRFPYGGFYVCRSNEEISAVIANVLSALNYKNDDNVSGVPAGGIAQPKTGGGGNVVRATTAYNDAALNFTMAMERLREVLTSQAYDRDSFERVFRLTWVPSSD